ncbi:MAG TPA: carboxypeptidase-like regulatory domain-containing protein, partial [Candidatus Saccharimonadales bacterium]|nr:carboxypeptidase-like regulatory domain-containing protein [Candidatus Saccharimonadales bacterium]
PYSLKRAELKLRATTNAVEGTLNFEGELFGKGMAKVPLTTNFTILDARQDKKPLPLEQENNVDSAVLAGPGDFSVVLDAALELSTQAGRAYFSIPAPQAGSVRLTLTVPGNNTVVHLSRGIITSRASENGQTTIEATLLPGQLANVSWATHEITTPVAQKESRFLSDVKTLLSVSETELRVAVLADITVVQGEPTQFHVDIPAGYELNGVTGASVDSSEMQSGVLGITVRAAAQRTHQFLITMDRTLTATKVEAPFLSFTEAQRETGEVLVEGSGTIELTATENANLKRMDIKETNSLLRSMARFPLHASFRYHKQPSESPALALAWTRFPDSSVLAAVAEHATITTLVTSEGKSLTEVKLLMKNQAQPFLKVSLPPGASILSADVAGEKVKPVEGPDGNRVPLLRPGFRPTDSYLVTFVFLHSGAPFAKKGGSEISLPKMDVPINVLQWELFLPQQYKVTDFGGDAIAAGLVPGGFEEETATPLNGRVGYRTDVGDAVERLLPGQLGGVVVDSSGAAVTGALVTVVHLDSGAVYRARSDSSGRWTFSGIPAGRVRVTTDARGFKGLAREVAYDPSRPVRYSFPLQVGNVSETVEVTAEAPTVNTSESLMSLPPGAAQLSKNSKDRKKLEADQMATVSSNVVNLQRRVSGVLPIRVDVPKAGTSFRFVRPLVLDEETKVTFTYKTK